MATAVSRGMTLSELRTIWERKECLQVHSPEEGSSRSHFEHKTVSLWAMLKNMADFLSGRALA